MQALYSDALSTACHVQALFSDTFPIACHLQASAPHTAHVMQALFSDAAATASYVDALAVVEFVSTFGKLWEAQPISLADLQRAVDSPADHPHLGELYYVLLSCVLLDQVSGLLKFLCHTAHIPAAAQEAVPSLTLLWALVSVMQLADHICWA